MEKWEDNLLLEEYPDPEGELYKPGILIHDSLTNKICKLLEIRSDGYNVGFKIDSNWLDGLRHPWEIWIDGKPWGPQ